MKKLTSILAGALLSMGLYAGSDSITNFGASYTRSSIKPNGFPDLNGNMGGVQGSYQYRPLNKVFVAVSGFWRYGENTGSAGKRDLFDVGIDEKAGYTFAINNHKTLLTPYAGFGYRHLYHHVKPNSGKKIKLYYNEFFLPIGFQSTYEVHPKFSMGFNFAWMPQVFSTVTFNVAAGCRWALINTYKNFKTSLPLLFHIETTKYLSIGLTPFFELWQDGTSTAKTQFQDHLGLPKNTYIFGGLELNIQYAF